MKYKSVAGTKDDPTISFVECIIDDRKYSLAYSFNSVAEAESATGCNLLSGMWAFLTNRDGLTAQQLRGLLYASLRLAQPEMTIQEAGALIRVDTFAYINERVNAAFIVSMPESKKKELNLLTDESTSAT